MDELRESNQQMRQQVDAMTAQLAELQSQVAPPAPPPRRILPVVLPDKFNGDVDKFPDFLTQCRLFIALRPEDFTHDWHKVGFVMSLLSGAAARWVTPLFVQNSPLLQDFQGFCDRLEEMFGDPLKVQKATERPSSSAGMTLARKASKRLKNLRQGQRPLQEYISEFQLLSRDTGWNEAPLLEAFQAGLSEELLRMLIGVAIPSTVAELAQLCLTIEDRVQSINARLAAQLPRLSPVVQPVPAPRHAVRVPPVLPVRSAPALREEPMGLGAARPRLSGEEKDRRLARRLCLYCGEPGHFVISCPKKRHGAVRP